MDADSTSAYLEAAAALHALELEPDPLRRVAEVFARNANIAQLVMEFHLPDSLDLAPGTPGAQR